jgi:hypothetical protein
MSNENFFYVFYVIAKLTEAAIVSYTSVNFRQTARRNNSEDSHLRVSLVAKKTKEELTILGDSDNPVLRLIVIAVGKNLEEDDRSPFQSTAVSYKSETNTENSASCSPAEFGSNISRIYF